MMKRLITFMLLALAAVTADRMAYAQSPVPTQNTTVWANGPLEAWNATPGGMLNYGRSKVATLNTRTKYVVQDMKKLRTLVGRDVWLKVKSTKSSDPCSSNECWVFWGKWGAGLRPNLRTNK